MKNLNFLSKLASWMEGLSSRIRPVSVSYPGSQSLPLVTERQPRDEREMSERRVRSLVASRGTKVTHMAFMLLFMLGSLNVWGADELYYTLAPANGSNNSYASNCDIAISGITWNLEGNSQVQPWKLGANNKTALSNTDKSIYSKTAIDENITKIEITHGAASNITVNSMTVIVSKNSNFSNPVSTLTPTFAANNTVTVNRPDGKDWSNCYYKITYNLTGAQKSANSIQFTNAKFYHEVGGGGGSQEPTVSLDHIEITGNPSKTYEQGQSFDPTGLTVTAYYEGDTDPTDVTGDVEWSFDPATFTEAGENKSVTATATYQEKEASETYNDITVTEHVVTPGTYSIVPNTTFWECSEINKNNATENEINFTGTKNDVTVNIKNGKKGNAYINSTQTRVYTDGYTMTFSVPSGYNITAIAFTADGNNWAGTHTASAGTMTDNKNWSGAANSVTITFGGTCRITGISVTYAAIVPEVTVDPTSLSFDTKQNIAVEGKTFTLTGANLSSGLTLAASAGFNVSPESITAADAMAQGGVEVTVTPAIPTETTTPVEGTVTISGGGLANDVEVDLSMAVTPTYAVGVAVNENAMGSATMDGGTASVYKANGETVALVATPASGHEFVSWTATSGISFDNANNPNATATITAAGTITANFQAQVCTGLAAPVLDDVTTTYQSATIAWNAVTNADGYVLNIKKHEGNVPVVTDELITSGVSFENTGLAANTQYDYSVMAVGDGTDYCDESNPLLEGNFTTSDYPSVAVTYSENNNSVSGGTKKIMTPFALPTEVTNEISGKTFVGWTTKSNFEDGDESDEETYFAKGADFTITSNAAVTLYAVYATAGSGDVTISNSPLTSAPEQGAQYVIGANHKTAGIKYFSNYSGTGSDLKWGTMDASTTIYFTLSGTTSALTAYDGSAYLKNRSGGFEMSTTSTEIALQADGAIRGSSEETATRLRYNSEQDTYGLRWYASDKSTGNPAYFYKVEQNVSYSDYVITGSVALPILDAPTGLTAGTYYEEQTITLAATNDAAIYYSLDGNDPTVDAQHLYSEPFTLSERGTTTIKAIAVKDGFEDSEIATATYTINLPFATVGDLFSYLEENSLTSLNDAIVTGVISGVTEVSTSYSNATYFISNDGTTTAQLQVFRGKYVGNVAVSDENKDKFVAGNKVTVRGNIETSSNTLRFAQNNYMTELTEKVLSSVTVGGTASKTAYSEEDNQFSFAGLAATANYSNTGYSKDVTNEVTWKANEEETYTVTEGGDVNVTATLSDVTSEPKVVAVTYTTKTVESISLSYDAITTYVGHSFLKPTVTASYVEDIDDEDVTELATFGEDAYNGAAAGTYPIAVSYKGQDASYTITVKAIANDQATAYTAAEINDIIANCYKSTSESSYDVYVKGIVVEDAYNKSGNSVYYISADGTTTNQFYIYNAKYFDTETSATGNVKAGDDVIVKGKIQNYNSATPELKSSTVVYQLREAEFAVANVAELEVGQADLTASDLEVSKDGNGEVTLVSNDESKATIVDGKIHAVGAGDVTITANLAATANEGSINYKANSTTFTVHVIAARTRYTVTFNADGGTGTDPVIANQLPDATVELPDANPYSKENNKFMGWQVSYNETVLEKALGESFTMPAANVTIKPKWEEVATCAISFMVNDAEVFSANAPQTEEYSLASATHPTISGFTFLGWSETEVSDEVEELPTMITSYTPEAGENTKVLYGIYSRVEEGANYGKYEKATAVAEGDYLIVCENQSVAFDGSLTTLDAVGNTKEVTIADGILTMGSAENYVFSIAAVTGGYSIQAASEKYIGMASNDNGLTSSETALVNTISISEGNADIVGSGSAHLRYNKAANQTRFRYFKTSSYSNQEAIQLYKKNEGTILYTSSPVEKVTITFNANGGEGGCEKAIINKGSQLTICAEAPTKLHSEFAGWKNSENVYVAGQAYTFNESLTLTAQWNEAATYAVTYSANGASGAVPTIDAQYAGDAFDVAAKGTLAKSGYDFQGWKYNGKLYAAGASFTMPASAVEFVAQWKKQNISTETMTLVTSESQLADGSKVVIANNKETQQYLAGQLSSKYLIAENTNVTFNGNEVTYSNANVTEWTLVKAENGWQLMNGENYLGAENDELTVGTTNATVWTITISNGEVAITSGDYTIRYNYNSGSTPRFKTYGSNSKLALPQLYASVTAITDDALISELGYVEGDVIVVNSGTELTMDEPSSPANITVKEGATVTVSAETHANNITVENGATIEVGATTAANNLVIQTTSGSTENQGKSGQLTGSVMPVVSGDLFIEIKLCEGAMDAEASRKWYCISAPFNVNMNGGFFWGDGTQMVLNTDFQLFEWDGDRRATGISGWKRVSGVMKAGIAYFIGFDDERSNQNIIKLKATNKTISNKSSISAPEHSSSVDDKYANWNGLANPNFRHIALNKDVQAFDHNIQAYTTYGTGDYNFVVGTPFFIKETGDITIEAAYNSSFRAPKREVEQLSYCVRIVREGKAGFDNQMYVRASEEASASYEEGHDLVTMNAETSNYGALLWTVNYGGKRLAIEEAPLVNDKASYALSLYAPADGAYRIETPTVREDASLYLTYEGNIIWDLTVSPYEAEFEKGQNNDYGLMLVRKAPQVTTGVETIDNSQSTIHNCQKVILNDHVYILRDGQLYDVTGKAVK